jgi:hypothetical protein
VRVRFSLAKFAALVSVLMLPFAPGLARADGIAFGAATRCEQHQGIFELAGVVQFNEQTTVVSSEMSRVRQLSYGPHHLKCRLGRHLIVAEVNVNAPSNGECMGAGHVRLLHFSIAGKSYPWSNERVLSDGTSFNFKCTEGEMVISIVARARASGLLGITLCTAKDWLWQSGYVGVTCSTETLE